MNPSVDSVVASAFSRRSFFRFAAGASALASLPILTESHLALAQRPQFADPNKGIHIDANENPLGPSEAARQAIVDIVPRGGRYLFNLEMDLTETFAKQEGLDPETVKVFAGSSDPLHYTVLAFTSKDRPLVIADPGYEAPMWAAKASGAQVIKVPLADPNGAAKHDVKAMLAASANPGVIYICNPNNPTGTCTPRAEIEQLVAGAPKDTVILIDEAYIHLCTEPQSLDFVKDGKNVIVLRTFSKLYGMAGIRMGFAIGRKDLIAKYQYFGQNSMPVTALVAAKASLMDKALVPTRRKIIGDTRMDTLAWLKSDGYAVTPSESNCFMLDVRRPGRQVMAGMAAKDIYIGRIWPVWPTRVRITVGTHDEMLAFRKAFTEVMAAPAVAAELELPRLPGRLAETPFTHMS
ncbi:pyridoxal phosphate-dependent aminotransferase [Terracidiphilus gabretensis]|uniref:pyridoxal phosphate-dependent aminotransferase n=1 Tax=Terracidiphilus gabretensis TaxID=1577687 RepID=UPI00071B6300|nr:pyridoxal phosphate-dependent aminotransferase [Terracidiphilus gabretensis]